jgi:hypothetical protein
MPPQTDQEFHDPVLKQAVYRCWACDCAPKELKNKIAGLLGESSNGPDRFRSLGWATWVIWPVAIAASVLLAFGLYHRFENHTNSIASALPVTLGQDLISRHDKCAKRPDHQFLKVAKNNDAAITDALHAQLHQPVLVFHPQDPNWQFRGAAVCGVGTAKSAHLVFVKGSDALSIFSLPAIPGAKEGAQYVLNTQDHCIVGFVKDGALFCLVSSGPPGDVSVSDLKKMEIEMLPAVARLNTFEPAPVLLTDLLRPLHSD